MNSRMSKSVAAQEKDATIKRRENLLGPLLGKAFVNE